MTPRPADHYDPDVAFPALRATLALVAERCERPCPLPRRPTSEAMDRMVLAELELSELTTEERRVLAHAGSIDAPAEEYGRIEAACPVADLLLDAVFEEPDTLEERS